MLILLLIDHLFLLALLDPEDVSCFQVDTEFSVFRTPGR